MQSPRSRTNSDAQSNSAQSDREALKKSLADADAALALQLIEQDVLRRIDAGEFPREEEYIDLFDDPPAGLGELIASLLSSQPTIELDVESASLGLPEFATTRYVSQPPVHTKPDNASEGEFPVRIDRYTIEKPLGHGAFGTVLLAKDTNLNRPVAIKLPHRHLLEKPGALDQFLEEACAVAKLSHSGIVPIFDSGVLDDGRAYAVLEYLSGGTLAKRLRRQPMEIMEAVDCLIQLADAAHYAHQRGIFHLDLKPSNVLLDEHGRPKISDFGLALDAEEQIRLKEYVGGTPSYMSPEQTRGETRRLDGRSDIWALGVILYSLLAGRLPFRADDVDELFSAICSHDPRPLRQINDAIPQQLDQAVRRCLEKQPRDRFETAGDLADELRDWKLNASGFIRATPSVVVESDVTDRPSPGSSRGHGSTANQGSTIPIEHVTTPRSDSIARWLPVALTGLFLVGTGVAWKMELFSNENSLPQPFVHPEYPPTQPTQPEVIEPSVRIPADYAGLLESILPADQWHPLLDRPPHKLHWPLIERGSRYEFKPATRELWLTVDGEAMMELGQTQASSYRVRATFYQPSWNGGTGLFWGYQPQDGQTGASYLRLSLVSFTAKSRPELSLRLQQVRCNESGITSDNSNIQSVNIPNPASHTDGGTLEIEVRNGELVNVWWCGELCPELVVPNPYVPVTVKIQSGSFGIFGDRSHTIIRRTAFKYLSKESAD